MSNLGPLLNAVKKVIRESRKIQGYDCAKVDDAIVHMHRMYKKFRQETVANERAVKEARES